MSTIGQRAKEALRIALLAEDLSEDLSRNDLEGARHRLAEERERALAAAPGVPVSTAAELLSLSEPTVRRLRDLGCLREVKEGRARRLEPESVLRVRHTLAALRAAGLQRGLVRALAEEAADRALLADPEVAEGLQELRRGAYRVVED